MAFVLKDRVKETTTTTGTGTVTLAGAVTGFKSFSAIGNANSTYYCIAGQGTSEWEVGIGTYTAAGTTLSRDTVLASSNSDAAVNFSAGTKDVFVTAAGGKLFTEGSVHAATAKTTLADNDEFSLLDSAASYVLKIITWANIKTAMQTWWAASGLGYATGAGGTVTQSTSKTTDVTLNKVCGQITMSSSSLPPSTSLTFVLNNTFITGADVVAVSIKDSVSANGVYQASVDAVGTGVAYISLRNVGTSSRSDAVKLNFAVIKGATA